jgi:membrane protein DedA with SNARE-associated domain
MPLLGALLPAWLNDLAQFEAALQKLGAIAPHWIYLAAALGVAIESFFPPIPADTFVLLGAFLTVQGRVTAAGVFLVTWSSNTAAALASYELARRWGRPALATPLGRLFLRPRQLERLAALYNAHGSKIIFFSRFLPAFRALVPVFAGVSHLSFWRAAWPIAAASAIWYGVLVYLGAVLGSNWRLIVTALENVNTTLAVVAGLLGVLVAVAWWKTRHAPHEREARQSGER